MEHVAPEEACGMAAGFDHELTAVLPITNTLHSHSRFRMDGAEQVAAMLDIERRGQALMAIFHSHPDGPPELSARDLEEMQYPDCSQLLWFRDKDHWRCRAFRLDGSNVKEVRLEVLNE